MKFFYYTVVAACAFTFTSITAEAETFTRIKSENDFRVSVVDKNLTSSWGLIVIHSNGTISGKANSSNDKLTGAWKWSGKTWCRNLRIGKGDQLGSQCMKISVSDENTLHIKGDGDPTVFAIGN